MTDIAKLRRELARLERESAALAEQRAALPPGSSRARVTTINARWARKAEARERVLRQIANLDASSSAEESR